MGSSKLLVGKVAVFLGFLVATLLGCRGANESYQPNRDKDPTSIYELSIRSVSARQQGVCFVEDERISLEDISDDWGKLQSLLKKNLPDVPADTVEDFKSRNSLNSRLSSELKVPPSFPIIGETEKRDIEKAGWASFYNQHPDAEGICRVSGIGFSSDGKVSLVYLHIQRSYNTGKGLFVSLQNEGGRWTLGRTYEYLSN